MEIKYTDVSSEGEQKEINEKKKRPIIPNSIRWKIIDFIDAGKSENEAATFYRVSKGVVSKLIKKYKQIKDKIKEVKGALQNFVERK